MQHSYWFNDSYSMTCEFANKIKLFCKNKIQGTFNLYLIHLYMSLESISFYTFNHHVLRLAIREQFWGIWYSRHFSSLSNVQDQIESTFIERFVKFWKVLLMQVYNDESWVGGLPLVWVDVKPGIPPSQINLVVIFQIPFQATNNGI